jgi:hypothetical protein
MELIVGNTFSNDGYVSNNKGNVDISGDENER